MSATNDGGPAFPSPETVVDVRDDSGRTIATRVYDASPGMTLRDYFAAKALPEAIRELWGMGEGTKGIAECAYQIADAMIAARAAK